MNDIIIMNSSFTISNNKSLNKIMKLIMMRHLMNKFIILELLKFINLEVLDLF